MNVAPKELRSALAPFLTHKENGGGRVGFHRRFDIHFNDAGSHIAGDWLRAERSLSANERVRSQKKQNQPKTCGEKNV
jgi:hypothetical protein